ncbi:unnamed protein product [Porites evermanni]|uniref:Uncharacterized protein n=1 Tax=Porites evermanni TaxID=104178 RepID=A0ABN8LYK7_9CNID|nr:unnamed protein product [Porites evermanni]
MASEFLSMGQGSHASRLKVIEHVVQCLTTERSTSSCVQQGYVKRYWDHLLELERGRGIFSSEQIERMENEIKKWELFRDSQIQRRKPSDLKVCYLGESNLLNNLQLLIQEGVLCRNVWVVAKDSKTLQNVRNSVSQSKFRNVRLYESKFLSFLDGFEGQFDIIYFDPCTSLAEKDALRLIGYVFYYNKLNSPGALITVFLFTPCKQPVRHDDIPETEGKKNNMKRESESSVELAHEDYSFGDLSDKGGERAKFLFDQYLRYRNSQFDTKSPSKKNDEEKYGDYITYQVIDSASLFVPVERMLISTRKSVWNEIFSFSGDILEEILLPNLEDIASYKKANESLEEQSQAPRKPNTNMTRWDHTAGESHLQNICSVLKSAETLRSLGKTWVDEIFPHWKKSCLQKHDISLLLLTPLLFSSHEFISSCSNSQFKSTCLDPISQCFPECSKSDCLCNKVHIPGPCTGCLVANLLYGQLANPSFPVIDKLLRLSYTSNGSKVFSDVFIFDRCEYLYDQFPTVEGACYSISEPMLQMVYRVVLEGLREHLASVSKSLFQFCDQVGSGASSPENLLGLPERQVLEEPILLEGKVVPSSEAALHSDHV